MPTLANPLGLIALLGIPAVLAIHFLQRKARELPVSTLFLLEHARREAASGRRFERLTPSIPLWMQLLSVLLLTWILVEPRYQKSGSIQRIAVVVDSSASMGVFKADAIRRLEETLPDLRGGASELRITVLESLPNRPRIYAGGSVEEMSHAISRWQATAGPVDPTQSLRLARSLVSRDGVVIYLTDTPVDKPPFEARLVTVGKPVDNVGFTGVSFAMDGETLIWRAMVRNHGSHAADRKWTLLTSSGSTPPRELHLQPGAMVTLQAAFPKADTEVRAVLSPDEFTLDDVLPMVAPQLKTLKLARATSAGFAPLTGKLVQAIDGAETTGNTDEADLTLASYNPLDPAIPAGNALVFLEDETRTGAWLKGGIIAEPHPLMDGLNWQGLLVRETIQFERKPEDQVLLWQDKRPLIMLRETRGKRQLLVNFDPSLSNAEKQSAFVILFHRFADSIRQHKVAPVSDNLETGQPITVTFDHGKPIAVSARSPEGGKVVPDDTLTAQSAMRVPGFQTVIQNGKPLLTAAVHFGDPREADLSHCGTNARETYQTTATIEQHTRADPLWRSWIILLGCALLIAWKFAAGRQAPLEAGN